jgi:LacI family transcriptional regulator
VPEDISITGFDDLDIAKEIPPGLTTVHAPLAEMGRLTSAYLLEAPDPDNAPPHIDLPAPLRIRGSTGPCEAR